MDAQVEQLLGMAAAGSLSGEDAAQLAAALRDAGGEDAFAKDERIGRLMRLALEPSGGADASSCGAPGARALSGAERISFKTSASRSKSSAAVILASTIDPGVRAVSP